MRPGRAREVHSPPDEIRQRNASEETGFELLDVPAAVVCANCGRPDCAGCLVEEPTHPSGIVAIIPWERPGQPFTNRLWATARVATLQHRSFFAVLPDGEIAPALAFAVVAELSAVAGLASLFGLGCLLAFPEVAQAALHDAVLRDILVRGLVMGLPALALFMVSLHALHGLTLDSSARHAGSTRRGRGARFGLYSCAWDMVTMPLGLFLLLLTDGPRAALSAPALGVSAPLHAAEAYLSGVHGLDKEATRLAARRSMRVSAALLLGGVALAIVVLAALFLS